MKKQSSFFKEDKFLLSTTSKYGVIQDITLKLYEYIFSKNTIIALLGKPQHCLYIENIENRIYILNEQLKKVDFLFGSPLIIRKPFDKIIIEFSARNAFSYDFVEHIDIGKLGLLDQSSFRVTNRGDSSYEVNLWDYDELIQFVDALYPDEEKDHE